MLTGPGFILSINMSSNTVRARLTFSFKGETYELDSVINLDGCIDAPGEAPDFHRLLAKAPGSIPTPICMKYWSRTTSSSRTPRGGGAQLSRWPVRLGAIRAEPAREQDWQAVRAIAERMMATRDLDADTDLEGGFAAAYRPEGERRWRLRGLRAYCHRQSMGLVTLFIQRETCPGILSEHLNQKRHDVFECFLCKVHGG